MPKGNNSGSVCTRIMKRLQGISSRTSILLVGAVIFTVFSAIYLWNRDNQTNSGTEATTEVSKAADLVTLKILPKSDIYELTDTELDALPKDSFNYIAMIDAGSSGCRAHVYRYGRLGVSDGPIYVLPRDKAKKVKPGLSSFVNNTEDAGPSLKGLVDFMKEQVPESSWSTTPVFLKATAGLRMLSKEESDAILNSVRKFLSNPETSPFYFRPAYAKLISGNEEGAYGWISYNYMRRIIGPVKGPKKESPYVVVEMGGASAQVSQLVPSPQDAEAIPLDYKFTFRLDSESYTLYTHSYLGYGLEQAREKVNDILAKKAINGTILDPCINKGYVRDKTVHRPSRYDGPEGPFTVVGNSNDQNSCQTVVKDIFPPNKECPFGPEKSYSFDCVYQPKFVADSTNVLVFENFYYIASGVNIPSATTPSEAGKTTFPLNVTPDLYGKASNRVCGETWANMTASYPKDSQGKDNNVKWCFGSTYAEQFITKGLGFASNRIITVAKDVDNSEIEWALGAAYKEALEFSRATHLRKDADRRHRLRV